MVNVNYSHEAAYVCIAWASWWNRQRQIPLLEIYRGPHATHNETIWSGYKKSREKSSRKHFICVYVWYCVCQVHTTTKVQMNKRKSKKTKIEWLEEKKETPVIEINSVFKLFSLTFLSDAWFLGFCSPPVTCIFSLPPPPSPAIFLFLSSCLFGLTYKAISICCSY